MKPRVGGVERWAFALAIGRSAVRRMPLARLAVYSVLASGAGLLPALFVKNVMDDALIGGGALQMLLLLALGILAARCFGVWLSWLRCVLRERVATAAESEAITQCHERLLRLPFEQNVELRLADRLETLGSSSRLAIGTSQLLSEYAFDGLITLGCFLPLLSLSPGLALVLLLVASVASVGLSAASSTRATYESAEIEARAGHTSRLYEGIQGLRQHQANGDEAALVDHSLAQLLPYLEARRRHERAAMYTRNATDLFHHGAGLAVVGSLAWFQLLEPTSIGYFLALSMWADAFLSQVCRLSLMFDALIGLRPELSRLDALAHRSPPPAVANVFSVADSCVELSNVWFRYDAEGDWLLRGTSLAVPQGAVVVLSGSVGRGKTTVLRLLLGLLRPTRGMVAVNGEAPRADDPRALYLPQEPKLFAGTLADNVKLYSRSSLERFEQAARSTGFDAIIAQLPHGLDSSADRSAARLSPGQRQSLLLTAALASEAELLLLDEPLANLDPTLRTRALPPQLLEGRTVVIVHHGAEDLGELLAPLPVTHLRL